MDAHAHHNHHDHDMHMHDMVTTTAKPDHVTSSVSYHVVNTTMTDHSGHHAHHDVMDTHVHHDNTHLDHHDTMNEHDMHNDHHDMSAVGGSHHHLHAHAMTFHAQNDDYILFESWQLSPGKVTFFVCLSLVVVAIIYQAIKMVRTRVGRKCPNTNCKRYILSRHHLIQTLFYVTQLTVGYMIMLAVMTYNVWVMVAAVIGLGLGYFFFGWAEFEEIVRLQPRRTRNFSARSQTFECGQAMGEELLPLSKETTATDISLITGSVACSCEDV